MRLIAHFPTPREARELSQLLMQAGVECLWEQDGAGVHGASVWIVQEDDWLKASDIKRLYENDPTLVMRELDAEQVKPPVAPTNSSTAAVEPPQQRRRPPPLRHFRYYLFTAFLLLLCTLFFGVTSSQEQQVVNSDGPLVYQNHFGSLMRATLYDYPRTFEEVSEILLLYHVKTEKQLATLPSDAKRALRQAEALPFWRGLYDFALLEKQGKRIDLAKVPMFEKIGKGEVWRFLTPALLHGSLLHLLFNLGLLWLVSRQIELCIGVFRLALLFVLTALFSNTCQYLMGGPIFVGLSGVVAGMVGFIWMRQKRAPWEGYPLPRSLVRFILFFIFALCALDFISFLLRFFSLANLSTEVANSAHVGGLLAGIVLARCKLFARPSWRRMVPEKK